MYNLYQSDVWKDIQYRVYGKKSFEIDFLGKKYVGTIKERKIGFWVICWLQILGVELPSDTQYIKEELIKIKNEIRKKYNPIFLQLGVINEIIRFENVSHRSGIFNDDMKESRIEIQNKMKDDLDLGVSFKENLPLSNIVYRLDKSDEEFMADMNSGCKERVKKAIKRGVVFREIKDDEYDFFYDKWLELSDIKGFSPISREQYNELIKYLKKRNCGSFFVAEKDGDLVAGSICIYDMDRITYLYGFSNRAYRNIGGHHFLKYKIFLWARDNGLKICDMMGGAPTGFPEHPLTGVSKFKESLGGTKIEIYGNYDMVFRKFLYKVMRWMSTKG